MTQFQPFVMERMMTQFEQEVDYNLSESGVHPLLLSELLGDAPEMIEGLLATDLNYPHVNGIPELRQNISKLYDGASPENVLVTVGAIESNFLSIRTLLSAGDEIVIMSPNYMQIWGVAKNHDLSVKLFHLLEENGWAPDIAELESAVGPDTKLIAICNPNNPTGRILTEPEMDKMVTCADRVGAWILADEVYRGATRASDEENPSFYGRYNKVLAIGSMSKAYGLPGLRIGWAVGPTDTLDEMSARREYLTLSATMLSNKLAALALSAEVRPRLLQRTREYIRRGYPILHEWVENHSNLFSISPPDAAAIAFVRNHMDVNSTVFTERLRKEKSVLIVPGDHFGLDHYLRISFGLPPETLIPALERIHELTLEMSGQAV